MVARILQADRRLGRRYQARLALPLVCFQSPDGGPLPSILDPRSPISGPQSLILDLPALAADPPSSIDLQLDSSTARVGTGKQDRPAGPNALEPSPRGRGHDCCRASAPW